MPIDVCPLTFEELQRQINYNQDFLEKEIKQQPVLFELICTETARRGHEVKILTIEKNVLKAELNIKYRREAEAGGRKTTVDQIDSQVEADPVLVDCRVKLAEAETDHEQWIGLKMAYQQRHDLLKSTCSMIMSSYIYHDKPIGRS